MSLFLQSLMAIASLSQEPATARPAPTVAEAPATVELASNFMQKLEDVAPTPSRIKFWGQSWPQHTWWQVQPGILGAADVAPPSPAEALELAKKA